MDAKINDDDSGDRSNNLDYFLKDSNVNVEDEVIEKILDEKTVLADMLKKCIANLTETEAKMIIYRFYKNFSYEEIAKLENTTVKSIDNALDRAKRNLREMLLSKKNMRIIKNFI